MPIAAVGLAAGAAAVVAAPLVLSAAGFTAGGVAAGSIAASIQSAVYGGSAASGSLFGLAQSAGAAGVGVAGNAAIGGITAGITGGLTALGNFMFVCFNYKSCSICLAFGTCFINFLLIIILLLKNPVFINLAITIFSLSIIVFCACSNILILIFTVHAKETVCNRKSASNILKSMLANQCVV